MSITPGAGDYLVWFSGSVENSAAGVTNVSLYLNGGQIAHTERQITTEASIPATSFPVALHARLTGVSAGQAIDVRWRTSAGTATMHQRTLVVAPISAATSSQATATADDTTTSAADVAVSGMSVTPGAGDYLIWFSGSMEGNTATTTQYASIYVNGSQLAHTERRIFTEASIPNNSFPVTAHAYVTGVGAGQAIEVRWRTSGGTATMHERTLVVAQASASSTTQVTATADATTTSASDVGLSGMSITPGAGDYLIWFSGSMEGSLATSTQYASIYVNGAQLAHTERRAFTEGSIPNTSFPVAAHAYVTGVGAGQAIEVRWRTTGGTATMHQRTLAVQLLTSGAATFAAAEDTAISGLAIGTTRRLRVEVSNEGTASSSGVTYQLQVAETAVCTAGAYTAVPTDSSGHWQIVNSAFITDGEPTSNISPGLFDEAASFVAGMLKDAGNATGAITLASDRFTEIEFAIQATGNSTPSGNYCFRLYDSTAAAPLDTYTVYAQASLSP
jgi:hypothetical protein